MNVIERKPPTIGGRVRRIGVAAAALLLLGTTAVLAIIHMPAAVTASTQEEPRPGAPVPATPTPAQAAQERLRQLAGTITAEPADAASGRYTFHRQRRWILDTTGRPVPRGIRPMTPAVTAIEIRRWEAADGSGRGIDVEIGPDYRLTGAKVAHRSTDREFRGGRTTRTNYEAGSQRSYIKGPPVTDPAALAKQLAAAESLPDGPQATLRTVDELFTSFYVNHAARRAVLHLLAEMDGLTFHERATDRLGRSGVAVSLANSRVEYALIFDRRSGRLLASQQRSIGAHEYLDVPHGLVRYYTLFIEQSRRSGLG